VFRVLENVCLCALQFSTWEFSDNLSGVFLQRQNPKVSDRLTGEEQGAPVRPAETPSFVILAPLPYLSVISVFLRRFGRNRCESAGRYEVTVHRRVFTRFQVSFDKLKIITPRLPIHLPVYVHYPYIERQKEQRRICEHLGCAF